MSADGVMGTRPANPRHFTHLRRLALLSMILFAALYANWINASELGVHQHESGRPLATLTVTNTNDSGVGSLRQAVIDAIAGDTIVFDGIVTGTITLTTGEILINKNLTITGPGAGVLALSGNNASRIFNLSAGIVTVSGLTIRNGRAGGGGAIRGLGSVNLTLNDLVVTNNSSIGDAGAMSFVGGTLNINRSTISNNSASQISALYVQDSTLTVTGSTFHGNTAPVGDVIRTARSNATLINTTISGNTSNSSNAAIRNETIGSTATLNLTSCTVTNNITIDPAQHGAIWLVPGGTHVVTLRNSIVSGNTSGGLPNDIDGVVTGVSSFNLIGTGGGLTNGVNGNIVGANNPLLGSLSPNGGPTQTHAFLPNSPALDKGNSLGTTTDQRGLPRPIDLAAANAAGGDGADIGAYEQQSGGPVPTPTPTPLPAPKADFQFQGNLTSSVAGAPVMTNLGAGNAFVTDSVDGYSRQTLRFPINNGLQVSTGGGLIPTNTYTIVILFRFDNVTGFKRVVDFANGISDDGAYISNARYEFEPTNTSPTIQTDTYFQAVIVREASGIIRAYRDGVQRLPVGQQDLGTFAISGANFLRFFQDDIEFPGEASAGNVARIRLYDTAFTDTQVLALDRLPNSNGGGEQPLMFASFRDGSYEIYTMNQDGSNQLRLTNDAGADLYADWSPSGQKIAFSSTRSGGVSDIYTMNADGSDVTRITTNPLNDLRPAYSPNASKLLFSRCDTNQPNFCDIWIMNADGTGEQNLTNNPANDDQPRWSPSGAKIVFSSNRDAVTGEVYTMNADGSGVTRLTTNTALDENPDFSPDGSRIAFASARTGNEEIFLMDANGSNPVNITNNPFHDRFPRWSADGTRVAFGALRDSLGQVSEVYSVNTSGGGLTRLTRNLQFDFPLSWRGQPVGSPCDSTPISVGQSAGGLIDSSSCLIGSDRGKLLTFIGSTNQRIAVSMESSQLFSKIELVDPNGSIIAAAGGVNGVNNARLPANGYFTLPASGTYTIRAIAAFGGSGDFSLSLFQAPTQACTYSLSSSRTDVPQTGGTFSFDIITQPGCPPAAAPQANGTFYTGATYAGGRVTFTLPPHPGSFDRQETMTVAGLTHTIFQYCICSPTNDFAINPNLLQGANSPPGSPTRGTNGNTSAEQNEPAHAGQPAMRSVWYVWTAPANGLWSFSTSGSSFDTVMAIYRCPGALPTCTFANLAPVGSNDDTTFFDVTSKVNFRADQGATYMIAVDGKNGATGTIELSWRQYSRLFRLYLQNFNGNQSPIVPSTVTASNGSNTVTPLLVSLGVYEFNLPPDGTTYNVTIAGPTGIVWNPNNFPLDTSFRYLDELMQGEGDLTGENVVANAQNETPRYVTGFIRNITQPEVPLLAVSIGSSRGPNPVEERPCSPLGFQSVLGVPYATYQCESQPNTLHDIVPNMAGKSFTLSVLSFPSPLGTLYNGSFGNSFIASNVPTYNITGRVLAGGAGTRVDLTYTPPGNTQPVSQRATTMADGSYSFSNLTANTYRLKAMRTGFVYTEPAPVSLQSNQTIDIASEAACSYNPPASITTIPVAGGLSQFTVTTTQPNCEWAAASDVPWITINSGAIVGNGPVHFTAQTNTGAGRIGSIRIQGRPDPILVQQATTSPTFGTIAGRVLTPGLIVLRNAVVTIIDAEGSRQTATTSSFGVYTIDNVQLGKIYTATVTSRRYRFTPKNLVMTASASGIDFVGLE